MIVPFRPKRPRPERLRDADSLTARRWLREAMRLGDAVSLEAAA